MSGEEAIPDFDLGIFFKERGSRQLAAPYAPVGSL